jgi:orotidine-5'-phosphate decarboxylase
LLLILGGLYKISSWSHFTNAHIVPGDGIIQGLKEASQETPVRIPRALLLLAEMSSKGSLATGEYTEKAVKMALTNRDFVVCIACCFS